MSRFYRHDFFVGGIPVCLMVDRRLPEDPAYEPFRTQRTEARYTVTCGCGERLPELPGQILWESETVRVYPGKTGVVRSFSDASGRIAAVCTRNLAAGTAELTYLPEAEHLTRCLPDIFRAVGPEAILRDQGRFCPEAALMDTAWGGILLIGPSGIGKSTQLGLWTGLGKARAVSDGLPALGKVGDRWIGWDTPASGAGSATGACCTVRGAVVLGKGRQSQITRLPLATAARRLAGNLKTEPWDRDFLREATEFSLRFASEIPVYRMDCTPDSGAVRVLEQALRQSL